MYSNRKTARNTDGTITDSGLTESPRPNKDKALKGEHGRIDEWAQIEPDGRYSFNYLDVGNYGKERWTSRSYVTGEQLDHAIAQLQALRAGQIATTRLPVEAPAPTVTEAPAAAPTEATAPTATAEPIEDTAPTQA